MLIKPWRHKPHGTFHLLPHPFFTTPQMGKLRLGHSVMHQHLCQQPSLFSRRTDSNGFTFVVVSEFAYDSYGTTIRFLNEDLPGAITSAFNRQRGRREVGARLLFQHLYRDNITDLVKCELLLAPSWGDQQEHPTAPIVPIALRALGFG